MIPKRVHSFPQWFFSGNCSVRVAPSQISPRCQSRVCHLHDMNILTPHDKLSSLSPSLFPLTFSNIFPLVFLHHSLRQALFVEMIHQVNTPSILFYVYVYWITFDCCFVATFMTAANLKYIQIFDAAIESGLALISRIKFTLWSVKALFRPQREMTCKIRGNWALWHRKGYFLLTFKTEKLKTASEVGCVEFVKKREDGV